jgi:GeoRSP system SPASM domain protein
VADRLVEGGLFFVTLDEKPLLHPAFDAILSHLTGGGCQVQFSCTGSEDELSVLSNCTGPVQSVLLDLASYLGAEGLDVDRLKSVVARMRGAGHEPALSLVPQRKNLTLIPQLVGLCVELGIARFKLPNAKLDVNFRSSSVAELPRWQDLDAFRRSWQECGFQELESPSLEIHDLFLWEIMTPGQQQSRSEYGGCQAGNSLGHVAADGVLYPCAAWPQALGSLLETSLAELWQGKARHTVRAEATQHPTGCEGCTDYSICFGGCRGLACYLNKESGERDLMCRGPRTDKP